jgi:hypothetical protein
MATINMQTSEGILTVAHPTIPNVTLVPPKSELTSIQEAVNALQIAVDEPRKCVGKWEMDGEGLASVASETAQRLLELHAAKSDPARSADAA